VDKRLSFLLKKFQAIEIITKKEKEPPQNAQKVSKTNAADDFQH
jgi:hypothetical protein